MHTHIYIYIYIYDVIFIKVQLYGCGLVLSNHWKKDLLNRRLFSRFLKDTKVLSCKIIKDSVWRVQEFLYVEFLHPFADICKRTTYIMKRELYTKKKNSSHKKNDFG